MRMKITPSNYDCIRWSKEFSEEHKMSRLDTDVNEVKEKQLKEVIELLESNAYKVNNYGD